MSASPSRACGVHQPSGYRPITASPKPQGLNPNAVASLCRLWKGWLCDLQVGIGVVAGWAGLLGQDKPRRFWVMAVVGGRR